MKKLLLGVSLLCFSLNFANVTKENVIKSEVTTSQINEEITPQINNEEKSLGDWGCSGTLYVYDDWTEEYVAVKSYSICCFDTAEQACSAVEEELNLVASYY